MLEDIDPLKLQPRLRRITARVGELLLTCQRRRDEAVGEADRRAESLLAAELQDLLPEAGLFSEEAGGLKPARHPAARGIDPLGGARDYLFRLPRRGSSIVLLHRPQPPVGGALL